ncbi:hypothetical protein ACIQXD_33725 [Streptomyces uncialis]|uniref:hypothetical protein n=1 Tax=Streptomyces uncialis TaxID=1048205 RepID=UPI003815314E
MERVRTPQATVGAVLALLLLLTTWLCSLARADGTVTMPVPAHDTASPTHAAGLVPGPAPARTALPSGPVAVGAPATASGTVPDLTRPCGKQSVPEPPSSTRVPLPPPALPSFLALPADLVRVPHLGTGGGDRFSGLAPPIPLSVLSVLRV